MSRLSARRGMSHSAAESRASNSAHDAGVEPNRGGASMPGRRHGLNPSSRHETRRRRCAQRARNHPAVMHSNEAPAILIVVQRFSILMKRRHSPTADRMKL